MLARIFACLATLVAATAHAEAQDIPRTAAGRPDFHGVWESRWLTPLERPDGTTTPTVSGDAAETLEADLRKKLVSGDSALHPESDYDFSGLLPAPGDAFRTSLIVEPADGKRPQTQIAKDVGGANRNLRKLVENPEALSNDERCVSAAGRAPLTVTPGSMYRQIVQTPGHLVIYTEDQMAARIIGIGGTPRPAGLVTLIGDSVATWEGDTLVVVTTQIRPQPTPPGGPAFDQQRRVTERFSMITPDQISYEYVQEDSAMLSAPMRVQYALMRTDHAMFESACHEGNYSLPNMLRGARLAETRKPKPKAKP